MTFNISWSISLQEWSRASAALNVIVPGSDYDRRKLALSDLLIGTIQLYDESWKLFPPKHLYLFSKTLRDERVKAAGDWYSIGTVDDFVGWRMSILDFAYKLATHVNTPEFRRSTIGTVASVADEESNMIIYFEMQHDNVVISTNMIPNNQLKVEKSIAFSSVRTCLHQFVHAVGLHAPESFLLETFRVFDEYREDFK